MIQYIIQIKNIFTFVAWFDLILFWKSDLKSDMILVVLTKQHPNAFKNIRFFAVLKFFESVCILSLDQFETPLAVVADVKEHIKLRTTIKKYGWKF